MNDKKELSLALLRHGIVSHGGARYEGYFGEQLHLALQKAGIASNYKAFLANRIYRNLQNLQLLRWGYKNASADVNIVVERLVLPALIRNRNSQKLVIAVLHNHDRHDGKGKMLSFYFRLLFAYIKKKKPQNLAVVVVAPYFKKYFNRFLPGIPVFLVPNLFQVETYLPYRQTPKNALKIHLGQYSTKNHHSVFILAKLLKQNGFYCYFSTLFAEEAGEFEYYDVKKMPFETYLAEMASSYCTIAFTGINEGWPRLNHESIMVGTPVIGYKNGGLGDLLRESGSYIVNSAEEAFALITGREKLIVRANNAFLQRYDISQTANFLQPVVQFIKEKF